MALTCQLLNWTAENFSILRALANPSIVKLAHSLLLSFLIVGETRHLQNYILNTNHDRGNKGIIQYYLNKACYFS